MLAPEHWRGVENSEVELWSWADPLLDCLCPNCSFLLLESLNGLFLVSSVGSFTANYRSGVS